MSVPPNMGHKSRVNTPEQITDLANALIYSCLVLFSLCHISISVITAAFALLNAFSVPTEILWYKLISAKVKPITVV